MGSPANKIDTDIKTSPVYQNLTLKPYEFAFSQAVYILQLLDSKATSLGDDTDPNLEAVRIKSRITYTMPNSEIFGVEIPKNPQEKPIIWMNFLSIAGIQGPLPMPYTEMIFDRIKNKDTAFRDFLDIFNHRLSSFWYKMTKKYKVTFTNQLSEKSDVGRVMLGLSGLDSQYSLVNSPLSKSEILPFFDFLWKKNRSATNLIIMIKNLVRLNVKINLWQGKWRFGLEKDLTKLGCKKGKFNILGKSVILGEKTWDQSAGILLETDQLDWDDFLNFIPLKSPYGGKYFSRLKELCQLYLANSCDVKVRFNIKPDSIKNFKIGNKGFGLGLNTFLKSTTKLQKASCVEIAI